MIISFFVLFVAASTAYAGPKTEVVQFLGQGRPVALSDVPDPSLVSGTLLGCFQVDMFDPRKGKKIGTGFDCLTDVVNPDGQLQEVILTDTAFFVFNNGMVVSQDIVEIRQAPLGQGKTHLTGSLPDVDNIIAGTQHFDGASGQVRLSGAVDMSDIGNGNLGFDCLFVITYDK